MAPKLSGARKTLFPNGPYMKTTSKDETFSMVRKGKYIIAIWTSAVKKAVRDGWKKVGSKRLDPDDAINEAKGYAAENSLKFLPQ